MRKVCVLLLLVLFAAPSLLADTQDTTVFRTRMSGDNEVPAVSAPGNSGMATITVRVTRDARGNINAATVIFDIEYTFTEMRTVTGLHIHNNVAGMNGSVVIDTRITGTNPQIADAGTGRIVRVVDYATADTAGLRFVTGLLAMPELYYVNLHTSTNLSGFVRGQLARNRLTFRPAMSPTQENPPIVNLNAEGAALIEIEVNRQPNTGTITSGVVTFIVDYRFPAAVTLTGLHIHNAAGGVNGPVVIGTDINNSTRAITNVTRGTVFRVVDVDSTNTAGLTALEGLMSDPTQYYINIHTTANTGGAMRGQLSSNEYAFFNRMTQAEEVPPTGVSGTADSMTIVRVNRDTTGNITDGVVGFNVSYDMGGAITFQGLHIHNARFGVNGSVVINTGLSAGNPVVDDDGFGSVNRPVTVTGGVALDSMKGLLENPENYYVNIHSSTFTGGIVRSQLTRETYRFKVSLSPANEVPPVVATTTGTGFVTVRVGRDMAGAVNGGQVIFDVNHVNNGAMTFTGLHIHTGAAGTNGPVVIDTGLSQSSPVLSATGMGNITRTVNVSTVDFPESSNANAVAAIIALINNPANLYVNLHSSTNLGGIIRSQLLPMTNPVSQFAGGGEWISSITVRNSSAAASVQGMINLFQTSGAPMPEAISDPNISFQIPPDGSVTFNSHNKGTLMSGFAKVFSNGAVTVDVLFRYPGLTTTGPATTVTSRSVSLPVSVVSGTRDTGIALLASAAGNVNLELRNASGVMIGGGSGSLPVTADQQIVGFVRDLLPTVTSTGFDGTLTITASSGTISVLGLQFNGTLAPVTVTPLP